VVHGRRGARRPLAADAPGDRGQRCPGGRRGALQRLRGRRRPRASGAEGHQAEPARVRRGWCADERSGSTLFGLFASPRLLQAARAALQTRFPAFFIERG
jgi:hypothetical protein